MGFFRKNKFSILIMTMLGLLCVFILKNVNIISLDFYIFLPIHKEFSNFYNFNAQILQKFAGKSSQEVEIENLKREINGLRDAVINYNEIKEENERLKKYCDVKECNPELKFVTSSVILRDPNDYFYNFTLDKGSEDKISLNNSVITEYGFIGYICEVNKNSSKVRTILAPDSRIGILNSNSNETGIISGTSELSDKNLTKIIYVDSKESFNKEDIVVTSGLSRLYPKNLKVGKVMSVEYENNSYFAILEVFENIKKVKNVLIITSF
ncbi:MAG: rod shape-determining protein MreC [Candidatus Paraimprobicoccus trichonymphae]|uniref:Cell shape-determining protein MreC n=1 Tax=Candidatus Paraimprobicoccus trichonymphae TaxID=3033793 RepID=A0AA48KWB6_9FIRM|nr:MAG: rod shape-determining protein MreC [Candidatus Paraimprobicoccus trichonymphae]